MDDIVFIVWMISVLTDYFYVLHIVIEILLIIIFRLPEGKWQGCGIREHTTDDLVKHLRQSYAALRH